MFCTLEDAWGEKNFNNKQIFKESDKPDSFAKNEYSNLSEHFSNNNSSISNNNDKNNMYKQYMELKEMFSNDQIEQNIVENHTASKVCIALDNHIMNCNHCRNKYLNNNKFNFKSPDFNMSTIMNSLKTNKDAVTIFLLGLLVLLLLQLFSKN